MFALITRLHSVISFFLRLIALARSRTQLNKILKGKNFRALTPKSSPLSPLQTLGPVPFDILWPL